MFLHDHLLAYEISFNGKDPCFKVNHRISIEQGTYRINSLWVKFV